MEQGSLVYRRGTSGEGGRVLATFDLTDDNLTEWDLHTRYTADSYALVQWTRDPVPEVVPVGELQEITEY